MKTRLPHSLFVAALVAFACSSLAGCAQQTKSPPPKAADNGPYDWEREGQIPPLDLADMERAVDRVDTFEDIVVSEDTQR